MISMAKACMGDGDALKSKWISRDLLCRAELRNAVTGILGAPLLQAFLAVRASELSWYSGLQGTPVEIVDQAAAQLYDRY